ncbi:MAG: hypothetical protein WDA16_00950 [Candidatus Thermoplasmatota archaeon]
MRLILPALGLAALILSGCITPSVNDQSSSLPASVPPFLGNVVKVGEDGNEPVVRVAPDGTIYVAALQYLYVSRDNGTTFTPTDFKGALPMYASDSALAVAPDSHAYIAFDWPYAGQTAVCNSKDDGKTWACNNVAVPGATDRMWLVAPTEKDVYLITGQTLDRPTFAVSHDAGASFTITSFDAQDQSQGSDLSWDPVQKLVVEAAASSSGPGWGVRSWKPDGTFVGFAPMDIASTDPTIAVDAAGTWWAIACMDKTTDCKLAAAKSTDAGKTWRLTPMPTSAKLHLLPFIAAGGAGRVAMGWYEANGANADDAANEWRVSVTQTSDGASWTTTLLTKDPVHKGAMCASMTCLGENRFAGDFLGLAFGPDSALHVTWMHQTGSKGVPATQVSTGKWEQVEYERTVSP